MARGGPRQLVPEWVCPRSFLLGFQEQRGTLTKFDFWVCAKNHAKNKFCLPQQLWANCGGLKLPPLKFSLPVLFLRGLVRSLSWAVAGTFVNKVLNRPLRNAGPGWLRFPACFNFFFTSTAHESWSQRLGCCGCYSPTFLHVLWRVLHGYLAHKRPPPSSTLQQDHA